MFDALIDDLEGRDAIGWAQYRRPLLANEPGRDWLTDAYEEALDQAVYLKGALMSRALTPGPAPAAGEGSMLAEVATVFVGFALVVVSFAAGYLVGGGF